MFRRRFIPPGVVLGPLLRPVGQVDDLEDLVDARSSVGAAEPVQPAEEAQVLARAEVRVDREVLRHVADLGLARGRLDDRAAGPATTTSPPSRRRIPQTIEIVVVLPAPFGPRRPYVSPGAISKLTPSTAWRSPNRLRRPLQRSTGVTDVGSRRRLDDDGRGERRLQG